MVKTAILLVLSLSFLLLSPIAYAQMGIGLTTDKAVYRSGEPIVMQLKLVNLTGQPRRLSFNTSQRYDFSITDSSGKESWHWSRNRVFLLVMGQERLDDKRKELVYSQTFTGKLAPGRYTITGRVVSQPNPFKASVIIVVR